MDENGTCVFMSSSPTKIKALYLKLQLCTYDLCNEDICFGIEQPNHLPDETPMDKNVVFWILIGAGIGCPILLLVICLVVKCICTKSKQNQPKPDTENGKTEDRLKGTI